MTEELPHIRCYECGTVIGNKWESYQRLLAQGVSVGEALNKLGLSRYCCRFHMMNPIKIPTKSDRQIDPRDVSYGKKFETLSVATKHQPVLAPLEALQAPSSGYTVVPISTSIELPPIPEVPELTTVSEPGAHVVPEFTGQVIRSYQAW